MGERLIHAHLPHLPDLQCAWLLLLYSASPMANHWIRVVPPSLAVSYARGHDAAMWATLRHLLEIRPRPRYLLASQVATLPGGLGGLGLRTQHIIG